MQMARMISVKDHENVDVVISSNRFRNISIPSALIYLNETEQGYSSRVVLANNEFSLIAPYYGVGVLDLRKSAILYGNFYEDSEARLL